MDGVDDNSSKMIPQCNAGIDTRRRVQNLEMQMQSTIARNQAEHDSLWQSINAIQNRPPVWCTALIALLTALAAVSAAMFITSVN